LALLLLLPQTVHATAKEHIIKGNKYLKDGDPKAARGEFESAQIDAPDEAFIPYNIGTTYVLEGNFDEAKRYFELANTMTKDAGLKAKIAYNLGHVAFYEGKRDEAINHYKDCLRLTPNDADAKYNIEYIRAGKTPKQPPPQQQKNDKKNDSQDKDKQQQQSQQNQNQDEQKKQEQKKNAQENAERVLQMMDEQEKEKLKDAKPLKMGESKQDKKNEGTEDW